MCSRYFTEDKRSGMRTEIHPCDEAAVFASGSDGRTEASMMYWGFRALKGNADSLVFNARSETVSDKVMFRESFYTAAVLSLPPDSMNGTGREKKPFLSRRTKKHCILPVFTGWRRECHGL